MLVQLMASINKQNDYKQYVKIDLNDERVYAYVDSGNNVENCMSVSMFKRLGLKLHNDLKPLNKIIGTAHADAPLTILGRTRKRLPLKFSGHSKVFYTRPLIVKNLSMNFNLSGPFLAKHSVDQLHSKGSLSIDGDLVPLVSHDCMMNESENKHKVLGVNVLSSSPVCNVSPIYLKESLTIPAKSMIMAPLRVAKHQEQEMELTQNHGYLQGELKDELELVQGFTGISQDGSVTAMVINRSDEECHLPMGSRCGTLDSQFDPVPITMATSKMKTKALRQAKRLSQAKKVIGALKALEQQRRSPRHR